MTKKISVADIRELKFNRPIVAITAYDALFARLFDEFVDIILVGDSLNMSFNGQKDTLNLGVRDIIYHTKAVCNGAKNALIVADMPFGSYTNTKDALKNAVKILKQTDADAVKLEGGARIAPMIKSLTSEGIAVFGHIGLRPQQVRFEGGYKIKGRESEADELIKDALALQEAGVFAMVLEGTISPVASKVAKAVDVPVVGIGAGANVDGQILVWSDLLGFFEGFKPKFVKRYLDGANLVKNALKSYVDEVKTKKFPSDEFEYQK